MVTQTIPTSVRIEVRADESSPEFYQESTSRSRAGNRFAIKRTKTVRWCDLNGRMAESTGQN
jgi:hypothetical protein